MIPASLIARQKAIDNQLLVYTLACSSHIIRSVDTGGSRMPSEAEILSLLITAIFDAAIDQSLWPAVLEQICDFVGGPAAMIFSHDDALNGHRFFSWGDDPH